MIRFTSTFPTNAEVRDNSGLPWGCVIQPFMQVESSELPSASSIARCGSCGAYINRYCKIINLLWRCNICRQRNKIDEESAYADEESRSLLLEMRSDFVECEVDDDGGDRKSSGGIPKSISSYGAPVFIAAVDITGGTQYLDLIKDGLTAALQVLPRGSLFGLLVFSDKIGMFNLRSPLPHVKYIPVKNEPVIAMDDVLPLSQFLVQVSVYESNIMAALESLHGLIPVSSPLDSSAQISERRRALGDTVAMLVEYVGASSEPLNVRVGVYLSGSPNHGAGVVAPPSKDDDCKKSDYLSPKTAFYRTQAERAAQLHICIDLFIIGSEHMGLSSIKFLSTITGGNIMWYKSVSQATLPQDMYRQLSRPQAFRSLLRIRTSEEFRVNQSYGHLRSSEQYEDLYLIEGCDPNKAFAFDFKFTNDDVGFEGLYNIPTVQVAFAYTQYHHTNQSNNSNKDPSSPSPLSPSSANYRSPSSVIAKRYLRILTTQIGVAHNPSDMYRSADADAILSLLVAKISRACMDDGLYEGRLLCIDWMTMMVVRYNEAFPNIPTSTIGGGGGRREIDVSFVGVANMRPLIRIVFGLLKSSLLLLKQKNSSDHGDGSGVNADEWIYAQCLWSGLDPRMLHRAVYPAMSSYNAPNNLCSQYLTLSRSSVETSGSTIFFVDAYDILFVYYLKNANSGTFPPPKDSLIRQTLATIKQDRLVTPSVVITKEGDPEAYLFHELLSEEENSNGPSFSQFMDGITREVTKIINNHN